MAILDPNEIFYSSFEPVQKHRFVLYMDGIPAYMIKKFGGVKFNQKAVELPHINLIRYVKGKTKWDPIDLALYSPITPSGAQAVMEWQRLHHESVTGRDGYSDFYKRDLTLNVLGPVGDIVSEIIIKSAIITSADLGDYDWASEGEAQEIKMQIQPERCIVNY